MRLSVPTSRAILLCPDQCVQVKAQAEPERYPEGAEGVRRLYSEGGIRALYRGLDTTIAGYALYADHTNIWRSYSTSFYSHVRACAINRRHNSHLDRE